MTPGGERHLRRLRDMADYRRTEVGRRFRLQEPSFRQQEELAALEWALDEILKSRSDSQLTERRKI